MMYVRNRFFKKRVRFPKKEQHMLTFYRPAFLISYNFKHNIFLGKNRTMRGFLVYFKMILVSLVPIWAAKLPFQAWLIFFKVI